MAAGSSAPGGVLTAAGPFPGLGPVQIRNRAAAAMKTAPPFRVQGFDIAGGQRMDYDLHVSQPAAIGTFTTNQGTMTGLRVGNIVYWQWDAQMIESLKLKPELEGKWVVVPPGSGEEWNLAIDLLSPTAWSTWVRAQPVGRRAPGSTFGGTPTVRLDVIGPEGGSLYVAADGPAYVLYATSNRKIFKYAFGEFGEEFAAEAPSSDDIFDLDA